MATKGHQAGEEDFIEMNYEESYTAKGKRNAPNPNLRFFGTAKVRSPTH